MFSDLVYCSSMIYIFWSALNRAEAKRLIEGLLEKRLIACASIFPVESIYSWKGKVEASSEIKVILKSLPKHFDQISKFIDEHSSYDVSEIVEVQAERVSDKYLKWIEASL